MTYLLDTNVISELRKPDPDRNVAAWKRTLSPSQLYLSVMVVGEIAKGAAKLRRRDAKRAQVFETWLTRLTTDFADRLLPITRDIAEVWGEMNGRDPRPVVDGYIAATAKHHGLTLVTRNVGDFKGIEVKLLNPFDPRLSLGGGIVVPEVSA